MKNNNLLKLYSFYIFYIATLFSFYRILFLIIYGDSNKIPLNEFFLSLFIGIRFDLATISFFLLPISLIVFIITCPLYKNNFIYLFQKIIYYYILFIISLSTIIFILDFGFYDEFYTRINYLAFEYLNFFNTTIKSILVQFPYNLLLIAIPFLLYLQLYYFNLLLPKFIIINYNTLNKWFVNSFLSILILLLLIRGGIQNKPLNFSNSNISKYRFINQLTINPIWSLAYSYSSSLKEQTNSIIPSIPLSLDESSKILMENFNENSSVFLKDGFPMLRKTNSTYPVTDYNVIIILMESFAGHFVGALGSKLDVTPNFDSLSSEGMLFTRMFSTGSRTNRGLSGTLLSFPAIPRLKSIFNDVAVNQEFSSIAKILKQRKYTSSFIFSGDLNYDNMKGFLSSQGYDEFYGREIFDKNAFSTTWGVSDEDLFSKSIEIICSQKEPFLSTILTISNHPPYLFPNSIIFKKFKSESNNNRLNAFKYSDFALGNFISQLKKEKIFNRTIFVILGDHGFISDDYDQNTSIQLASYNIPCLILSPNIKPITNNRISSQIDIIPTILELLGGTFIHHSWGTSKLSNVNDVLDYAIMVPAGTNHLAAMVKENNLLIYNFLDESKWYDIKNFPYEKKLKKIEKIEKKHLNMEKTMLGLFKVSAHTLNTYKFGIEYK